MQWLADRPPVVRLAHVTGAQGDNVLMGRNGVERLEGPSRPALLVSFAYLKGFLRNQNKLAYRDWALDSGAFSAHYSGVKINLSEYIAACKWLLANDPTLTEVFSLDVIGEGGWKQGLKNVDRMWNAGVPAIPCYHFGEPWEVLETIKREWPGKIAIGNAAKARGEEKLRQAQQIFARLWPARVHGFGFSRDKDIMALSWHSVDATTWQVGPCRFGRWNYAGRNKLRIRGSSQNLRAEVEWYLKLERRAQQRWAREMRELDAMLPPWPQPAGDEMKEWRERWKTA